MTPEQQLEWLWANCRITYYPRAPEHAYPLEHAPLAGKDMRSAIEAEMRAPERLPYQGDLSRVSTSLIAFLCNGGLGNSIVLHHGGSRAELRVERGDLAGVVEHLRELRMRLDGAAMLHVRGSLGEGSQAWEQQVRLDDLLCAAELVYERVRTGAIA